MALLGIQRGFLDHIDDRVVTTLTELSLLTTRLKCDTKNAVCGEIIVTMLTKVCLAYPVVLHIMCVIHG